VTLLLDEQALSLFSVPKPPLTHLSSGSAPSHPVVENPALLVVAEGRWRGLEVLLGSSGYTESGIVSKLSSTLSKADINVYYLSTYNTDYILVPEEKLSHAISCLKSSLSVDFTGEDEDLQGLGGSSPIAIPNLSSSSSPTVLSPISRVNIPATKLETFPNQLYLASLKRSELPFCMQAILRIVFFPNSPGSFFCFTETEEEFSMILDSSSASHFMEGVAIGLERPLLVDKSPWRAIKRVEKLSFSETGVVSAISTPLGNAHISILYLSTFRTSFIIIREDKLSDAVGVLRESGFTVI